MTLLKTRLHSHFFLIISLISNALSASRDTMSILSQDASFAGCPLFYLLCFSVGAIHFNGIVYFQVIQMLNNVTRMAVGMPDRGYESDTRADMKADQLIKEEATVLRVAMGHEYEDIDEFVEAHKTCLIDIMYFPTSESYGLSSVVGNAEKLAAFQKEFDTVKKRRDDDTKKAVRREQKIQILMNGYQMWAVKIWSQVEATFKQMDTVGTEYECFQALKRQEQLAASNHINSISEDVKKQKEQEKTLQNRYGDLLIEQERIHNLMEKYIQEAAQKQAEAEATATANREDKKNCRIRATASRAGVEK